MLEKINREHQGFADENGAEEAFDPENELGEIKRYHGTERRAKLENYKKKLALQKEGLASMYENITAILRQEPDIDMDVLRQRVVNPQKKMLGLTDEQIHVIETVLHKYKLKRNKIKQVRNDWPDDNELFGILFRRKPVGRVEILAGPMTFHIRCWDEQDYAYVYRQKFITNGKVTQDDIAVANKTGGGSLPTALQYDLRGCLNVERVIGRPDEETLAHEEQHAIKRLFNKTSIADPSYEHILRAKNSTELQRAMERWLRSNKFDGEEQVKDEILAYLKTLTLNSFSNPVLTEETIVFEPEEAKVNNKFAPDYVYQLLIKPGKKDGLYDYFNNKKRELSQALINSLGEGKRKLIEQTIEKIFITEYHDLIKQGIRVFINLRERGFSTEETIGLLIMEPLRKWPKILDRVRYAR